jgi:Glyoxalase-like domain
MDARAPAPSAGIGRPPGSARGWLADGDFVRGLCARSFIMGWWAMRIPGCSAGSARSCWTRPTPWGLARFWSGLLGGTPVQWYPGWVTLEPPPHGQRLSFQVTGAGRQEVPRTALHVHFDVLVSDLAAAHERVLAAGAAFTGEHTSPRPGPSGQQVPWRVYRDPAGHPFCLVIR